MSSFSENFQREEKTDTQYDDSAFYTFALALILVGVVTLLIIIIRRILYDKHYNKTKIRNCECSYCTERLNSYYSKLHKEHINISFYFYIMILIGLLYVAFLCYGQVQKHSGQLKGFNPYEILEIDETADERTIKKAYKRLALQYHPDKNPNNIQAKAHFILIAKAYDALTNEESKKNFEKWGNPDGPGSMKISVALPSFILEKKNHMPILVLFLIFILVIFPAGFLFWFSSKKKYNDSGMIESDVVIFYYLLNENILLKQLPFVMGRAYEYLNLPIRYEETEELYKTYKQYIDLMSKHKIAEVHPSNKKAICILYSYLENAPLKYTHYNDDLKTVLKPAQIFIENMYAMCIESTLVHLKYKQAKNFGYNCVKTIFEFSQNLHQRCSYINNNLKPFMQLPHLTDVKLRNLSKTNKKIFNNKPTMFNDFLSLDKQTRDNILTKEFSTDELTDINKAIDSIPLYDMKVEVFVEGFEDILVEDFVTFKLTIVRKNLNEGETLGVCHSCYYPEIFKEKVSLFFLIDNKTIIYHSIIEIKERVTTHEYKFPIKEIIKDLGVNKYTCEIVSLNYKGIDQVIPLEVNVMKSSEKRQEHLKEIQKREIKKIEPSYFQKMLNQLVPLQNEDEDEEEEDEEEEKKDKDNKGENKAENENEEKEEEDNKDEKNNKSKEEKSHEKQD